MVVPNTKPLTTAGARQLPKSFTCNGKFSKEGKVEKDLKRALGKSTSSIKPCDAKLFGRRTMSSDYVASTVERRAFSKHRKELLDVEESDIDEWSHMGSDSEVGDMEDATIDVVVNDDDEVEIAPSVGYQKPAMQRAETVSQESSFTSTKSKEKRVMVKSATDEESRSRKIDITCRTLPRAATNEESRLNTRGASNSPSATSAGVMARAGHTIANPISKESSLSSKNEIGGSDNSTKDDVVGIEEQTEFEKQLIACIEKSRNNPNTRGKNPGSSIFSPEFYYQHHPEARILVDGNQVKTTQVQPSIFTIDESKLGEIDFEKVKSIDMEDERVKRLSNASDFDDAEEEEDAFDELAMDDVDLPVSAGRMAKAKTKASEGCRSSRGSNLLASASTVANGIMGKSSTIGGAFHYTATSNRRDDSSHHGLTPRTPAAVDGLPKTNTIGGSFVGDNNGFGSTGLSPTAPNATSALGKTSTVGGSFMEGFAPSVYESLYMTMGLTPQVNQASEEAGGDNTTSVQKTSESSVAGPKDTSTTTTNSKFVIPDALSHQGSQINSAGQQMKFPEIFAKDDASFNAMVEQELERIQKNGNGNGSIGGSPIELDITGDGVQINGLTPVIQSPNMKPVKDVVDVNAFKTDSAGGAGAASHGVTEAMISYHEAALAQLYADDLASRKSSAVDIAAALASANANAVTSKPMPTEMPLSQVSNYMNNVNASAANAIGILAPGNVGAPTARTPFYNAGYNAAASMNLNMATSGPFYQLYQTPTPSTMASMNTPNNLTPNNFHQTPYVHQHGQHKIGHAHALNASMTAKGKRAKETVSATDMKKLMSLVTVDEKTLEQNTSDNTSGAANDVRNSHKVHITSGGMEIPLDAPGRTTSDYPATEGKRPSVGSKTANVVSLGRESEGAVAEHECAVA